MDDAEIERTRTKNMSKVTARGLEACLRDNEASRVELDILMNGPHAKAVVLAILDVASAVRTAMRRNIPIWQPYGEKASLLYELVTDRSDLGLRRVKNLLDAGWDPNLTIAGTNRTPLMQVANAWNPSNRNMAAMLLAAGAKVDAKSVGGQSALDYAPVSMRNFIQSFVRDIEQDTTNRSAHTGKPKDAI